jgi:hypothetical protein
MTNLLGDFSAKLGREESLELKTLNESLHGISNDNGVRVVNFATSRNLFPHCNMKENYLDIS